MRARCLVDNVALGQVYIRLLLFPPVIIILQLLHTLLHLHVAFTRSTNEKSLEFFRNREHCVADQLYVDFVARSICWGGCVSMSDWVLAK